MGRHCFLWLWLWLVYVVYVVLDAAGGKMRLAVDYALTASMDVDGGINQNLVAWS